MKYAVGIDVGGTNTRVALINEKYEIKERVQFGSDPKNPIKTLNQINDVIKGFGEKIEGIGISCPGPLDLINGIILTPPNLPGWRVHRCHDSGYWITWKMHVNWQKKAIC